MGASASGKPVVCFIAPSGEYFYHKHDVEKYLGGITLPPLDLPLNGRGDEVDSVIWRLVNNQSPQEVLETENARKRPDGFGNASASKRRTSSVGTAAKGLPCRTGSEWV